MAARKASPRTPIVFSHANGFPAGTYRVLFDAWRKAGHPVHAVERFGHDPQFAVTSNWPHVRDELIHFLERTLHGEPAHLVGHSLGGYVSLLVALRRPDLVKSVVLIDSPVLAGWRAHSVHMAKVAGLIGRVSPGKVSQRRRQHWPSADDALKHFQSKSAFARWDPRVLRDYVAAGMEPCDDGVRLAFRREIETRFYNTVPHHIGALLHKRPPKCPIAFIGGTQSAEIRQVGMAATRAATRNRIEWIEGTHLVPMEQPKRTAQAVLKLLDAAAA